VVSGSLSYPTFSLLEGNNYRVFNIPGLIDNDESRIEHNKIEIKKAFALCPTSVICYIFGTQNGRIRLEELSGYRALHKACDFKPEAFMVVVNALPPKRPTNYDADTAATLKLAGVPTTRICFIDFIANTIDKNSRQKIRLQLVNAIRHCQPAVHKPEKILLSSDEIQKAKQKQIELIRQTPVPITLQSYRCGTRNVIIPLTEPVCQLIKLGQANFRWHPDRAFIWFGRPLGNSETLEACGLQSGDTVLFTRDFSNNWGSFANYSKVLQLASRTR